MPELGKATYFLVVDKQQYSAALREGEMEAKAAARGTNVALESTAATTSAVTKKNIAAHEAEAAAMKRTSAEVTTLGAKLGGLAGGVKNVGRELVRMTGFVGIAGMAGGLFMAVKAGTELNQAMSQMHAQLRANGESVSKVTPYVEVLQKKYEKLGFTNAQTTEAFTRLDRAAGSAAVAYKETGLAADLAATKHVPFAQAALMLGKVIQGSTTALNRYGIVIPKGVSATEALAIAQKKLAGQAEAMAKPTEVLKTVITDLEAKIGQALIPSLEKVALRWERWLSVTKNQTGVLNAVKTIGHDVGDVLHYLTVGLTTAWDWSSKLDKALGGNGGFGSTLKLLIGLLVSYKVGVLAAGLANIAWGASGVGAITAIKGALISTGIGLAFIGLGLAAMYVMNHWEKVKGWFFDFLGFLKKWAPEIGYVLFGPFGFAAGLIIKHWGAVKDWVVKFAHDLAGLFTHPLATVQALFHDAMQAIIGLIKSVASEIGNMLASIPTKILGIKIPGASSIHSWGETLKEWGNGGAALGAAAGQAAVDNFNASIQGLGPPGSSSLGGSHGGSSSLLGGSVVATGGADIKDLNPQFMKRLQTLAQVSGSRIEVFSGYRNSGHGGAGFAGDPHSKAVAVDAYAVMPDGRRVPLGTLSAQDFAKAGLRSGNQPGFYKGAPDPSHVDMMNAAGSAIRGGRVVTPQHAGYSLNGTDYTWDPATGSYVAGGVNGLGSTTIVGDQKYKDAQAKIAAAEARKRAAAGRAAESAAKRAVTAANKASDDAAKALIDPITKIAQRLAGVVATDKLSEKSARSLPAALLKVSGALDHEIHFYKASIEKLTDDMVGKSPRERKKLQAEIDKLKLVVPKLEAELHTTVKARADIIQMAAEKIMATKFGHQYTAFSADLTKLQKLAGITIPGTVNHYGEQVLAALTNEQGVLSGEVARAKAKFASATGKARATYAALISKLGANQVQIDQAIEGELSNRVSLLQTAFDTAKSAFETAYGRLETEVTSAFQKQTDDFIKNTLGPRFFQGLQTPSEKKLADMQAQDEQTRLQDALTQAQTDYAAALLTGVQSEIDAKKKVLEAAQRDIDEHDLSIKASAERAQADKDYAKAVEDYTNQRTVQERQLTDSMEALRLRIENGTGTLSELNGIMATYGVTMDGVNAQLFGIDFPIATAAFDSLTSASHNLLDAFNALIDWVNSHTGSSVSTSTVAGSTQGGGGAYLPAGGQATKDAQYANRTTPSAHGPHGSYASGGIIRRPTVALMGEEGPELITPLSKGRGDARSITVNQHFASSPDNQFAALHRARFAVEGLFG